MHKKLTAKIKQFLSYLVIFYLFTLSSMNVAASEQYKEFRNRSFQLCDTTFHKLEKECSDMICRDYLVDAWTECWKISMNKELNKRLLKLKSRSASEFNFEMNVQKNFNQAVHDLCGKNCLDPSWPTVGLRGISYNFCRVGAYKYRTAQAIQINKKQLSIPLKENFGLNKPRKEKAKDTKFFYMFTEQLCKMPRNIWDTGNVPIDCQKEAFLELNNLEYTDDVCDLS